jgi:uncharacterized protein (TIGR02271 family)
VREHRDFNRSDPRPKREVVVPVIQEEVAIRARERPGDEVRVRKTHSSREETVSIPLTSESVEVQRIPVGAPVDGPVAPWRDGDTIVIPVVEQVPVVRMQWIVREEIRITRTTRQEQHQQTVRLDREDVTINRTESPPGQPAGAGAHHKGGTP